ncbi:hypothetical protein cypCar_00050460, partial [Cyprinus carpio]
TCLWAASKETQPGALSPTSDTSTILNGIRRVSLAGRGAGKGKPDCAGSHGIRWEIRTQDIEQVSLTRWGEKIWTALGRRSRLLTSYG